MSELRGLFANIYNTYIFAIVGHFGLSDASLF